MWSLLDAGTLPEHMLAGSFTNSSNLSGDRQKIPPGRPQPLASLAPHSLVKPPASAGARVPSQDESGRADVPRPDMPVRQGELEND